MRTIIILIILLGMGVLTSCKKNKTTALTTERVEVVEVAKPEPETPKPEVQKPVKKVNYYLVAGCFEFKENAERLHNKLVEEGYDSKMLPFYDLTMVTYDGYETREEAQVALNRIVREEDKELTWVYPVR